MEHLDKNKPDFRTDKRRLGDLGENIACDYLTKHGFKVINRNYLRKWGEIDIVAKKSGVYRFIEVKSVRVTHVTNSSVTHVTPQQVRGKQDSYRPEENVHPWKLKRLHRAIQTYMIEQRLDDEWQLDIITVKINETKRMARVEMIENIVI